MEIKGRYTFNAPAAAVWDMLMDADVLKGCVPGCDELEALGDDRYRATLTVNVAAVSGTYQGLVAISDRQEPSSYRMSVEGSGRPGFVNGSALIALTDRGAETDVDVTADVKVGGLIAAVGQRLLGSVSKTMMDRFFACLTDKASQITSA
jgi:hypothetical protein